MMTYNNFGSYFDNQAKRYDSKELMRFTGDDSYLSYKDIMLKSNQIANILHDFNIKKGDVISVLMPNQTEWPFLFTGVVKTGAIINFINYKLKEELEYVLNDSLSEILFISDCFIGHLNRIIKQLKYIKKIIIFKNTNPSFDFPSESITPSSFQIFDLKDLMRNAPHHYINNNVTQKDPAILVYTSGSTGKMKGVVLTHQNILSQIELLSATIPFTDTDKYLCQQPLFYLDYAFYFWLVIAKGGSSIIMNKFSCSYFWNVIEKYEPSFLNATPAMLNLLIKTSNHIEKKHLNSLQYISCCGEILDPSTIHKWEAKFPGIIYDTYTVTEISCSATVTPFKNRRIGSVGLPYSSNQVAIMDEYNNLLDAYEIGEVCIKGPCVMKGYWRNEYLTKKTIINDWYHSNDLGYYDKDGYFFITGRKNNIINKGGEKISPVEIENIIKQLEDIDNCVVIGVPDPIFGFEVAAMIETHQTANEEKIITFLTDQLASFKIPKYFHFTTKIPLLNTGKIDKLAIKTIFLNQIGNFTTTK